MTPSTLAGLRVGVYARFSSDKQRETSIEDQVARARRWAEERAGSVRDELIFADFAVSGTTLVRPSFQVLDARVRAKPRGIDVVLIEDVSRLSRSGRDVLAVLDDWSACGVRVVGIGDGYDSAGPEATSQALAHVHGLVGSLYISNLRDKTLRGMEGRARAGKSTGGLPLGYRSVPEADGSKRIEVDPERAPVVERIFKLYASGASYATIAATLTRESVPPPRPGRGPGWVDSAVRAILGNARYAGRWSWGARQWKRDRVTGKRRPVARAQAIHVEERPELAIVAPELWLAVEARLAVVRDLYSGGPRVGTAPSQRPTQHMLSGLLVCGACGGRIELYGVGTSGGYLRCAAVRRGTCNERSSFSERAATAAVLDGITEHLDPRALAYLLDRAGKLLDARVNDVGAELAQLRARLVKIRNAERSLASAVEGAKDLDVLVAQLRTRQTERRDLEAQILDAERSARGARGLPSVDALVAAARDFNANVADDPATARETLRGCLDGGHLVVTRKDCEVLLTGRWSPVALLNARLQTRTARPVKGEPSVGHYVTQGCGGPLRGLCNAAAVAREWRLAA